MSPKTGAQNRSARLYALVLWVANRWRAIVALYFATIILGAAVFCAVEDGHSYWKSVWWAFITGLSIGYGDVFPVTVVGQVTGIILAHVILLLIVPMIVAQVTLRLIRDEHQYTDAEQRWNVEATQAIAKALGVELPPLPERQDA